MLQELTEHSCNRCRPTLVKLALQKPAAILILRNAHQLPCNLLQVLESLSKVRNALIMAAAALIPVPPVPRVVLQPPPPLLLLLLLLLPRQILSFSFSQQLQHWVCDKVLLLPLLPLLLLLLPSGGLSLPPLLLLLLLLLVTDVTIKPHWLISGQAAGIGQPAPFHPTAVAAAAASTLAIGHIATASTTRRIITAVNASSSSSSSSSSGGGGCTLCWSSSINRC
jgi:hypothetical protein